MSILQAHISLLAIFCLVAQRTLANAVLPGCSTLSVLVAAPPSQGFITFNMQLSRLLQGQTTCKRKNNYIALNLMSEINVWNNFLAFAGLPLSPVGVLRSGAVAGFYQADRELK